MIAADKVAEIDQALVACQGDRTAAATVLQMEVTELTKAIHNNADLKLRWGDSRRTTPEPGTELVIHRPAPPEEQAVAEALDREDAIVRKGLDGLGLDAGALNLAMAMQKLNRKAYASLLDMMCGGMAYDNIRSREVINDIEKELKEEKELDAAREMMLRDHHVKLLDLRIKQAAQYQELELTRAKVEALKKGKKDAPKKPKGFLAIQAQPGSQVNVKVEGEEDGQGA